MASKRKITWDEYQGLVAKICRDISVSGWTPDYVVGITRGGLLPAKMISYYFDVPCETLKVSLRDHIQTESNTWMAEDAFGLVGDPTRALQFDTGLAKKILIVDDINDTGATLNWIMEDWRSSCHPNNNQWDYIFNNNVRFAVLFDNLSSECDATMDYSGEEINKAENDIWIDFPYEDWWVK